MDRAVIPLGIVAVLVGLGSGFAMVEYPAGLNPGWPIWIALIVPIVFVLGGLHIIANGLGYPKFSGAMLTVVALCLLAIVNWAAFFTNHIQCREAISFLGAAILERYPSEVECRDNLRIIMVCIDTVVLLPLLAFAWRKLASVGGKPSE
ncbi:MAG: hypothetical protein C5B56_12640 [Proteobacteria bacterium]|nr:MAG: hypothetical protein C5B56_12640 [Pseudomonadota bacterium]